MIEILNKSSKTYVTVGNGGMITIPTDLEVEIPAGNVGLLYPAEIGKDFRGYDLQPCAIAAGSEILEAGVYADHELMLYNNTDAAVRFGQNDVVARLLVIPCSDGFSKAGENSDSSGQDASSSGKATDSPTTNGGSGSKTGKT